jgi:hypothetical protein
MLTFASATDGNAKAWPTPAKETKSTTKNQLKGHLYV